MTEEEVRHRVRSVLEPLISEFAKHPNGANDDQINQLKVHCGIDEVPAAVDEYLRLVGADRGLVGQLFAGETAFEIDQIVTNRDWKQWILENGTPGEFLDGSILYSETAEYTSWLLSLEPACGGICHNPQIASLTEDGSLHQELTFLEDLETRVPFARENLYWLRREVDDGIGFRLYVSAEFGTADYYEQVEEQILMALRTYAEAGMEPPSPFAYRDQAHREAEVALRRRLRD